MVCGAARLAVKVLNLATQQPSKEIEKRGPAVSAAFDAEGKPTKASRRLGAWLWHYC